MRSRKPLRLKKTKALESGSVLIAKPLWESGEYNRAVIIVLNHDEFGSTGIILNKQSSLMINEALPMLDSKDSLYFGGSFDTHTVSFLHTDPTLPESIGLGNELYWGGNFNRLQEMIANDVIDPNKIKFFAGFVEWNAGQLESEIEEDKWWVSDIEADDLFSTSAHDLWSHELLSDGHVYGALEEIPDPCLN